MIFSIKPLSDYGANEIYQYDATRNNCQRFVNDLLSASGLLTPSLRSFIIQKADQAINSDFVKKVVNSCN